jgi:Tol biopolymer transport system component/predicted Ser/Thr protein kinase
MVGRILSHYRIVEKLGEGGMGEVYKAFDTQLERAVAIKVLPPGKVADAARRQRFVQEAKAASALSHPNIITIHEIRSGSEADFIVMEYVEGRTLDRIIRPEGIPQAEVLKYAIQISDALTKAHTNGIVHRDLKPSNVMVTDGGRVKVLDFGLAKVMEQGESSPEGTTVTARQLTEEGTVMGTAAYMSPEQAEGRTLDGRSDIFSFGTVLYEMLTGRRPFKGDSTVSVLAQILKVEPTPPAQLVPRISPDLEKIVLRCLRKDPARRFQTMADLKVALEDAQESDWARQPRATRVWLRWAWAALLPVLLAAAVFAWRAWRKPETAEPLQATPLTTQPGVHRYPSFSPEGTHVAFTWDGPKQDNQDIYVHQIGAGAPLRLTNDPGNDYNPVWSPDGRWIAFLRSRTGSGKSELRLIPPLGGPERHVTDIRAGEVFVTAPYLTWCPDSTCLVVSDSPGDRKPVALFLISLENGEKTQLTRPEPPASGDAHPAVSPDGRWLVFRRGASGIFSGELHMLSLATRPAARGESRRLTPATLDANHPTWSPGSEEILFSAKGSLWRLNVLSGAAPARLPFVGEDGIMPAVSRPQPGRPSRLVYVRSFEDMNIWRLDTPAQGAPAPSQPFVAIHSTRREGMPQLSPDGRRVAFFSDRTGPGGIWVADLDGGNALQIAAMDAFGTGYPHWSPDGRLIVFHSSRGGQGDVYVVPATGGKPRNLTAHPALDSFPSFSRDGRWIYFTSNRSGESRVWKVPAAGGDALQVTNSVGYMPAESPDGAYLYYMESVFSPGPLWREPRSGGSPFKLLDGVVLGNYVVLERGVYFIDRPSGKEGIYRVDQPSGETRLQFFDFATRRSTTVARNLGHVDTPLTATADGRTILYSRVDSPVNDLMLVEGFR